MDRQVIIEIKGIKKRYKLGQIGSTTLQHRIQSWWAKKTGKEDPNSAVNASPSDHIQGDTVMALNGIDLTIYRGESIGIIGRNGRGKSTLLKLLSRVTAPTEGTIDIYGRIASMLEVGTGFDPELTGRENIYLNGAILGMTTEEIDSKMEQIIDFSEVRDFIDTPVKRYSSGMYSKLAFSVAAHLDSDIMIMDEVLAVGDAAFQAKCIEIMKRAVEQEGRTVLYVSHNMNQIRSLCSRCAVLHEGKIVFLGDTDKAIEIYSDNELKQDTDVSYTDFGRPAWIYDDRLRIVNARYTDEASIIFTNGRKANVSMLLHSTRDLSNVGLRVEVRNMAEFDRPIGIFVFDDICSMKKDEDVRVDLEYDLSMLVDGSYGTLYCFYEADEFGSYQTIDWVHGLPFIRQGNRTNEVIKWDSGNWGYISLPGGNIKKVEHL